MTSIAGAIENGLQFLSDRQLPSGQFPVEITYFDQQTGTRAVRQDPAVFASAHIAYSLDFLPHASAREMVSRTFPFFLNEMTGHGVWHYWNKEANWPGLNLYKFIPADLDDTASVSYLLKRHGVQFPDNRPLLFLNRNRGGLFYTWLVLRPRFTFNAAYWRSLIGDVTWGRYARFFFTHANYGDIDGVVNANVLLYLGSGPETSPVVDWLIRIVQEHKEAACDKWYAHPFMFYYALSRNVQEGSKAFESVTDTIVVRIQEAVGEGGRIGEDELHTALAVNTALNLGTRPPYLAPAVEYIMNSQHDAGSWPSSPYYCTPDLGQTWGSQELTTAFCLEALYRFQELSEQPAESRQIAMSGYRTMPPDARLEERILRD